MEIISSSHMNVEKEIFNPDGRIRRPIVLLDVYGFKPFQKLVFHNLMVKHRGCVAALYRAMLRRRSADICVRF